MPVNKEKIVSACLEQITQRIESYNLGIKKIQTDMASETKSSAGDKFETSREMMKQEEEKLAQQISELKKHRNALQLLTFEKNETIQNGSIVETNKGVFYFSTAFGKIIIDGKDIMLLSTIAPIFNAMKGKKKGDNVTFNTTTFLIHEVN